MKHVQVEEGRGPRPEQARIFIGIRLAEPENDGNCDRCDAISNENPTLSSMGIEGNRVEKSLEHPSHPSQTILKKVCGTCYKKRNYEQLGIPAKGKVSEGACQDCGSHAELLIDISEPRSNRLADLNDNA
jgi:hypothetical protein